MLVTQTCLPNNSSLIRLDAKTKNTVKRLPATAKAAAPVVAGGLIASQFLNQGSDSTVYTVMNILELTLLLKYCTVGYPDNAEAFFEALSNDVTLFYNPLASLIAEDPPRISSWHRFELYEEPTSILENCGGVFFMLALNLTIVLITRILQRCLSRSKVWRRRIRRIQAIFEWNNTVAFLLGAQVDLALGWALQFAEPNTATRYGIVNFVIGIVSLPVVATLYIIFSIVVKKYRNWQRCRTINSQNLAKATLYNKVNVLWNDFNTRLWLGRNYVFVLLLKNTAIVLSIYGLSSTPVAQSSMILVISVLFFIGICLRSPFREKDQLVVAIINELLWILQVGLVHAIGINQALKRAPNNMTAVGWVLIGSILAALIFNILVVVYEVIVGIKNCMKRSKRAGRTATSSRQVRRRNPPLNQEHSAAKLRGSHQHRSNHHRRAETRPKKIKQETREKRIDLFQEDSRIKSSPLSSMVAVQSTSTKEHLQKTMITTDKSRNKPKKPDRALHRFQQQIECLE